MSKKENRMVGVQNYNTTEGGQGHCFLRTPISLRRFFKKNNPANFDVSLVGDPFWGFTDVNTEMVVRHSKGLIVEAEGSYYDPTIYRTRSEENEISVPKNHLAWFQNITFGVDECQITGYILLKRREDFVEMQKEEMFSQFCRIYGIKLVGEFGQTKVDNSSRKSLDSSLYTWHFCQPHLEPIKPENQKDEK